MANVVASDLPDEVKLSAVALALHSSRSDSIRLTYNKLAAAGGLSASVVINHVTTLQDSGWLFSESNLQSRIVGRVGVPKQVKPKARRVTKFSGGGNYGDVAVRDWKVLHFIYFLFDELDKRGETQHPPPKALVRNLNRDGIERLRALDRSGANSKVRYRQYLLWALDRDVERRYEVLRDRTLMEAFTDADDFQEADVQGGGADLFDWAEGLDDE